MLFAERPQYCYGGKCGIAFVCHFTHLYTYVSMRPSQNASRISLWYCTLSFIVPDPKAVWTCFLEQCCVIDPWNVFLKKLKVSIVICWRSEVTLLRLCCFTLNHNMCRHTGGSVASEHKMSIVVWSSFYWLHCLQNTFFPLQVEYLAQIQSTMIGGLKVEILLHRIYKYTHSERVRLKNVCLCELGMPIIFIFYMLMEGEPMCFKQKKKI